jgi:predicted enzyme related to lactoylglutathione lyase
MLKRLLISALVGLACYSCAPQDNPEETAMSNHHRIDYVEFAATDIDAFKKFYSKVFGWEFQDWGPDYSSFSGAGIEGGVRGGEAAVAGSTTVILYSDDLEESERAVDAAGGVITAHHDFPGGRRFHFRDCCGNELAVWTKAGGE